MDNSPNNREKLESWLREIESVLNEYDWQETFILRTCEKKLNEVVTSIKHEMSEMDEAQSALTERMHQQWNDHVPVYITLYNNAGSELSQWENVVNGIRETSAGRPIYEHEADARAFVDRKDNKQNEGYIKLYILPQNIVEMPPAKKPYDLKGAPLLVLRPRAILSENISKFVHANQVIYRYSSAEKSLVAAH